MGMKYGNETHKVLTPKKQRVSGINNLYDDITATRGREKFLMGSNYSLALKGWSHGPGLDSSPAHLFSMTLQSCRQK